jgi:uncharacterized protein YneF (UPF0154 family)
MRVFLALLVGAAALGAGFAVGTFYGTRHVPQTLGRDRPPDTVVAYFRTLDLCGGNVPTDTSVGRTLEIGQAKTPEYQYHYRCPDGRAGVAYETTPLEP